MDASMASYHARLATFQGSATKSRRMSSRSKKAPPKSKGAWPLSSPSAEDLAYAGFVWVPTSASPDNVQCWLCNCQLDGWEEADIPAFEHLTHSPTCGFAIVNTIRLRHGDPGRTEDDPIGPSMMAARVETFGDMWPLDTAAGYPGVDQLAAAGWYYDPTSDTPDGVSCAYCHLALDAWDAGDDPSEEHRRRAPDCLFFALNELYHPKAPEPKKAKRTNKRASTRSSVASTSSTTKKASRTKKQRASEAVDDTVLSESSQITKKTTRGRKPTSEDTDDTQLFTFVPEASKKTGRGKKRTSEEMDNTQLSTSISGTSKKSKQAKTEDVDNTQVSVSIASSSKNTVRGKKHTSEAVDDTQVSNHNHNTITSTTKSRKRTSEAMVDTQSPEPSHDTSKRMRYSSISSLPDDLPVGTPKKMPTEMDTEPFTMSSLPASLLVGTPKRTPPHLKELDEPRGGNTWQPTDIDTFFTRTHEAERAFVNEIIIDGGLDDLTMTGTIPEDIKAAVLAGLTDVEREMSIEQWVLYNAQRGEEKLRNACEQQTLAFEAEGRRALTAMEGIATY